MGKTRLSHSEKQLRVYVWAGVGDIDLLGTIWEVWVKSVRKGLSNRTSINFKSPRKAVPMRNHDLLIPAVIFFFINSVIDEKKSTDLLE